MDGHQVTAAAQVVTDARFWTATAIFAVSYGLIMSEKLNKTVVAVFGAALMIVLGIVSQHESLHAEELGVDWNVIFLLVSMMVTINLVRPSGLFEYIAIRCAKLGRGEPVRIMLIFAAMTAVMSSLFDNVTTVLLIAPVTLFIADALEVDAVPMLLAEVFASNIGGTATLIGDPPNIMVASRARLDFVDFLYNLTPVVLVIMAVFLAAMRLLFAKGLKTRESLKARVLAMDEREAIKDAGLLVKSLVVLAVVMIGFVLHGALGYEPATVAMFGAALMLIVTGTTDPRHALAEVEWPTIAFFVGLFIIVGGVVKVGLIRYLSFELLSLTQGDMFATSMSIMWFSAVASSVVDNIPFVATMNPMVVDMARHLWPDLSGTALVQNPELMPVWWSLALGACLGGNGTAIGASANVIVVGMAERAGSRISFGRFLMYGMPVMAGSVALSSVYVWLRYFVLKF